MYCSGMYSYIVAAIWQFTVSLADEDAKDDGIILSNVVTKEAKPSIDSDEDNSIVFGVSLHACIGIRWCNSTPYVGMSQTAH